MPTRMNLGLKKNAAFHKASYSFWRAAYKSASPVVLVLQAERSTDLVTADDVYSGRVQLARHRLIASDAYPKALWLAASPPQIRQRRELRGLQWTYAKTTTSLGHNPAAAERQSYEPHNREDE